MSPVSFTVAPGAAYDYLAEPANRPAWQASLRTVEDVTGEPGTGQSWIGQSWTDVTWPGLRPRLRVVVADRPRRWGEAGTWHAVRAELVLTFEPSAGGCVVTPDLRLPGRLGTVLARPALYAVRADLRRAARILAEG